MMTRLEEFRSLRREEMRIYFQKVLPSQLRLKRFTIVGLVLFLVDIFTNAELLQPFLFGMQLLIGAWWLGAVVEVIVYRVQLNLIQDKIYILRQKQNEKNKTN